MQPKKKTVYEIDELSFSPTCVPFDVCQENLITFSQLVRDVFFKGSFHGTYHYTKSSL